MHISKRTAETSISIGFNDVFGNEELCKHDTFNEKFVDFAGVSLLLRLFFSAKWLQVSHMWRENSISGLF